MASSDDILKSVSLAIESENKQKLEFLFTSLNKKLKNLAFLSSEDICDRYQQGKLYRNFLAEGYLPRNFSHVDRNSNRVIALRYDFIFKLHNKKYIHVLFILKRLCAF